MKFEKELYDVSEEVRVMITEERTAQHLSQQELAKKAGISPSHLCNIEHGSVSPTVQTLYKIAKAFGKDLKISFDPID